MLQLRQIRKTFYPETPNEKKAIKNLSLTLNDGDFVTIIGSNGAGKSTLLNLVAGVLFPDDGELHIDHKNLTWLPEFKRSKWIGRVFQDPMAGTAPNMTIEENLALALGRTQPRSLRKGVGKKRRVEFQEHLQTLDLGLEDRLTTKVGLLSGGERQALSLLMATFTQPRILLLDEHTAALDPARAELITRITEQVIQKYHLTTLMVTHNMEQALQLGNRMIMMDDGEIIFEADEEEKSNLTIPDLMEKFAKLRGRQMANDRALLQMN